MSELTVVDAQAARVSALLAETMPDARVFVGRGDHHPGMVVRVAPRTRPHDPVGARLYWRAFFLAGVSPLACWECWWADVNPADCDHERVWV